MASNRAELEKSASAALEAAQQPAGDLRDLSDDQLTFIESYWAERPRVSNDDVMKAMRSQ